MKDTFYISQLIKKSITGEISPEEQERLNKWLSASTNNEQLFNKITDTNFQQEKLSTYQKTNKDILRNKLEDQLFENKTRFISAQVMRYAAAILLPLLVAGGLFMFYSDNSEVTLANIDSNFKPGMQKATLILSDGKELELDENKEEETIQEKGVVIRKKDKALNYKAAKDIKSLSKLVYNELKTPRGGNYQLQLADGTRVWLNSGSSIKFPVEFTDSTRQVFLKGEAYFDVSHNGKPFIVNSGEMNIRVLGTEFNVTAYDDEQLLTTTLVEGKVAVEFKNDNKQHTTILSPGLQAVADKQGDDVKVSEVTTSHYTSWINGKLEFHNQNLDLVMKRIARWYDFDYAFENEAAKNYHFTARMDAGDGISEILSMLEMTTKVKFEIENNTIVIN